MDKKTAEKMESALREIYSICVKEQEKKPQFKCKGCPANKQGRLCHHAEISCCAPHHWWDYKKEND